jgi:predicted transcriptional regulator
MFEIGEKLNKMGEKEENTRTDTSTDDGKTSEAVESSKKTSETKVTSSVEGKNDTKEEPKFTQEQVNEMLGKIRHEGREVGAKNALDEVLKATGAESVDALTEIVSSFKDKEREEMSELEKLQTDLSEAMNKVEKAEEFGKLAEQTAINAHAKAAVLNEASAKFQDGEAVWQLLDKDLLEVKMEDGTVEGVKEALDGLAERYPFLLRKKGASKTSAANPAGAEAVGRTDEVRRAEYFGMGSNPFWGGQGVRRVKIEE